MPVCPVPAHPSGQSREPCWHTYEKTPALHNPTTSTKKTLQAPEARSTLTRLELVRNRVLVALPLDLVGTGPLLIQKLHGVIPRHCLLQEVSARHRPTDRLTSTGSPELKHTCAVKQRQAVYNRVHSSHRFWTVHGDHIALDRIVGRKTSLFFSGVPQKTPKRDAEANL